MSVTHIAGAQDLAAHHWQDRLLLIVADAADHPALRQQLAELQKEKEGLDERKLVIYQVLPGKYRVGLDDEGPWQISGKMYNRFQEAGASFSVLLIGLDGGTKLGRGALLSCEELFAVIDGMPMRRAEMRKKSKGG